MKTIGSYEKFPVIDLYNDKKLNIRNLVKFKRMKNPQTGTYMNYAYPKYTGIPFNPEEDEYPYPMEAIQMTYDGLHPSDQGYEHIAQRLIEVIKTLNLDL